MIPWDHRLMDNPRSSPAGGIHRLALLCSDYTNAAVPNSQSLHTPEFCILGLAAGAITLLASTNSSALLSQGDTRPYLVLSPKPQSRHSRLDHIMSGIAAEGSLRFLGHTLLENRFTQCGRTSDPAPGGNHAPTSLGVTLASSDRRRSVNPTQH